MMCPACTTPKEAVAENFALLCFVVIIMMMIMMMIVYDNKSV